LHFIVIRLLTFLLHHVLFHITVRSLLLSFSINDGTIMIKGLLSSGFVLMTLSAFFFAITDILIKYLSPTMGTMQIAFVRFFLGVLMLVPVMRVRGEPLKGSSIQVLLVRGLTGTLAFLCLLQSIAMIPLSNAMVLFYTFPLFATLFSFVLLGEPLTRVEIGLTIAGTAGIYILINPASHALTMGHLFGLLAACFAGITVVLIRRLRKTNGPLVIYFYFCLIGGIITMPFFIAQFSAPRLHESSLLVLLAVLFLVAQIFMNQGFKYCKASEGSVILMSELVFTGIAGVAIFNDSLSLGFWVGAFLIVGSGVGLNLMTRQLRPIRTPLLMSNEKKLDNQL
jgi:drug/metabolite transporter (DMT)-like permease